MLERQAIARGGDGGAGNGELIKGRARAWHGAGISRFTFSVSIKAD